MSDGVKETLCSRCIHRQVCLIKERYLKFQKQIDDLYETFKKEELIESFYGTSFIKPIELKCRHYISDNCYGIKGN